MTEAIQEPYWNFPMAVSWIKLRSPEALSRWRKERGQGEVKSLIMMGVIVATHPHEPSMLEARAELLRALGEGEVGALGLLGGVAPRQPIPKHFWAGVELQGNADFSDRWVAEDGQVATDLIISRSDVVRNWPGGHLMLAPEKITRGRKATYNWLAFEKQLDALLDHHGLPDASDPEWESQAMVEKIMATWADSNMKVRGKVPSESLIREHVAARIAGRKGQ